MPKADVGSSKWLGNKMKSKGLQKLRWFCQMCQKQCRDQNGFKCHMNSESHQRQLLVFAQNPKTFLDEFSGEFESNMLRLIRSRFGTKRVHMNVVYQEYIADKSHCHMNATRWSSLTGFCKYLGRTGKCEVDHTEKGWFIKYIDRDPETLRRQEELEKKKVLDKTDEEKMQRMVRRQATKARKNGGDDDDDDDNEYTDLVRDNEDEKIVLSMSLPGTSSLEDKKPVINPLKRASMKAEEVDQKPNLNHPDMKPSFKSLKIEKCSKKSALDELREEEEQRRERMNRKDFWLHESIVVKVTTKKLGMDFYKKKGVVEQVIDEYTAVVKLIDSEESIKVDQAHIETVIPAIGKVVLVVNGAYRNSKATLETLNQQQFCATLKISEGPLHGRMIKNLAYEDFCKLNLE